ncbi:MAG: hypothetical protein WBV95_05245, partial [Desulfobacterales bacterium]
FLKTTGEVRLILAVMAVTAKKWSTNDAVLKINTINICLVRLLPGHLRANSQANGRKKPDYKPHLKIACRGALKAASYIFVLSIIPPR